MDQIDMEIQGMLKKMNNEPYYYEDLESDKGATEQIYATFLDNCTIKLEKILSDLPIGTVYHNKDSTGKYLYMFPEKLRMVIRLKGRVLKHYEFEVLNE